MIEDRLARYYISRPLNIKRHKSMWLRFETAERLAHLFTKDGWGWRLPKRFQL